MWRDNNDTDRLIKSIDTEVTHLSVALCALWVIAEQGEMLRYWEPVPSVVRGQHNVESDTDTETQRPTLALTPPCPGTRARQAV